MKEYYTNTITTSSYNPLKILIAEDEYDIAVLYKTALEEKNHEVTITGNGEECLKIYHEIYQSARFAKQQQQQPSSSQPSSSQLQSPSQSDYIKATNNLPFDVVILDCKMPNINGIEVAKEILAVNPHQRIIFASAYIKDTVIDPIKNLKQVTMESIQKPFEIQKLIDLIEDKEIYEELEELNVDMDIIKAINPTHEQVVDLLERLHNIQK